MWFKEHFFLWSILFFVILTIATSFYRFYYLSDYTVTYETECDPYQNECFAYCGAESCENPFYYSRVTRQASTIKNLCGVDITECAEATTCGVNEPNCFATYCTENDCDKFDIADKPYSEEESIKKLNEFPI
jgi:hypothetical protein